MQVTKPWVSLNKNLSSCETNHDWSIKIFVLNVGNLSNKFEDIREHPKLLMADSILLSETWIKDLDQDFRLQIPGYKLYLNNVGDGKGLATYIRHDVINCKCKINENDLQISVLENSNFMVISIYRSQSNNSLGNGWKHA